jgi:hypothetical protein
LKDFYTEGVIKNKGGFSVGAQTGVGVWTAQCDISSTGNISTNGTITSTGNITSSAGNVTGKTGIFNTISCTGTLASVTQTVSGVHAGLLNDYAIIEMPATNGGYIDIGIAGSDYKGRLLYSNSSNAWTWRVGGTITSVMTLNSSGLSVVGTITPSSDKRLKFNEKPIVNALDIIKRLEPVEYDQTYYLVDEYTPDTPQSHQSGFIAQHVQQIDELNHAVIGGEIGDDGKESLRGLNYNAVFAYAVKAIQELSQIVQAQQVQIYELQQLIRTTC